VADHYEVLDVARDADTETIKKAYRRLARELHPDVNPAPEAEEQFKLVTHAYEVLSDPVQREQYDLGPQQGFPGGFGDFSDIFSTFFNGGGGGGGRGPRSRRERGQDALIRLDVSLADVIFGVHQEVEIDTAAVCETCAGNGAQPGTEPHACDICRGSGHIQRTVRSLIGNVVTSAPCGSCRGFGTTIPHPCSACAGQGRVRARRTVPVDIPAGVDTGVRLHLPGQGEAGPGGGVNGDLYLEIRVDHDDVFNRAQDDLLCTLEISMIDAILGTTVTFPGLDGDVTVDVKPGVQSSDVLTVKDRGITRLRGSGRGDLKVGIHVLTPTKLSSKEKDALGAFAKVHKAPEPRIASFQQGIFAKLRDRFF
jgi:molecular chaperone DnaJ